MLSLSPRFDLFRFVLPNDFLPQDIKDRYSGLFKDPGVLVSPIDYLNESIKGITIPGMSDVNIKQNQHSYNTINTNLARRGGLGRLNIEPNHENNYVSPTNPLASISPEFKVTFRLNQGMYNYFMLYETLFRQISKPDPYRYNDFVIDILSEEGTIIAQVYLYQCLINGIDGLDFSYDKVDRQADTFDVTWVYNNINMKLLEPVKF